MSEYTQERSQALRTTFGELKDGEFFTNIRNDGERDNALFVKLSECVCPQRAIYVGFFNGECNKEYVGKAFLGHCQDHDHVLIAKPEFYVGRTIKNEMSELKIGDFLISGFGTLMLKIGEYRYLEVDHDRVINYDGLLRKIENLEIRI